MSKTPLDYLNEKNYQELYKLYNDPEYYYIYDTDLGYDIVKTLYDTNYYDF